jgi:photosystem II stability/assembly factor-like uncharacterized protein
MARRISGTWMAAAVVLLAGCAGIGGGVTSGGTTAGKTAHSSSAAAPTMTSPAVVSAARPPAVGEPFLFQSLRMTSATSGWALGYATNPAQLTPVPYISLAHTADGARTWTNVTPSAARPMLAGLYSYEALDAVDGERAYLAVTVGSPDGDATSANPTGIFATDDGGRTWSETAMFKAAGDVTQLTFVNAQDGWLLMDEDFGGTPQPVWLYRTVDGGRHWSPATTTSPSSRAYGSNGFCHAMDLTVRSASTGWLTVNCRAQSSIMVSHDGGSTWVPQALPLPASDFLGNPATMTGPQFVGGTGFLTVAPAPPVAPPALPPTVLVSRDLGQTWHSLALPSGAGQYPQISFFTPADGVLVAAGSQEALGTVFYTTTDGGQTWMPVPQGTHFAQLGATIDFTSPQAGFEWTSGGDTQGSAPPSAYVTTDSGRTWRSFIPKLVALRPRHMDVAATGPRTVTATFTPGRAARPVAPPPATGPISPG